MSEPSGIAEIAVAVCLAVGGSVPSQAEAPRDFTASSQVPEVYFDHVTGLLRDGFDGTATGLRTAEQHFQAAQQLRKGDPALAYAYGLVLLKNRQYTAAMTQFRLAADGDTPFLPAIRAVIRDEIRLKHYNEVLDRLDRLAERIGTAREPPDPMEQRETARWMGRVVGFMTNPQISADVRERATAADPVLQERLGERYRKFYDLGRQDVLVIEAELSAEQQQAAAAAKLEQQAEQEQSAARSLAYQNRGEELRKTREEWDAWLADATADLDPQLEHLTDRFETLNRSIVSLAESITAAQLDLRRLENIIEVRNSNGRRSGAAPNSTFAGPVESQVLARSQELNTYLNEYSRAQTQRDQTAQQAQALLAKRAAAEQKYREATGAVAKQATRVQGWDARLKRAMDDAAKAPASSRKMKAVANRSRSFSTYDNFDLEAEQQRLLQSLANPPN